MTYRFLRYPGGLAKAVTFSYDDGLIFDKTMSDIITPHSIKCTFNIINSSGDEGLLTPTEIKEYILERGHEAAVHNIHHLAPGKTSPLEGIRETLECKKTLERDLGIIIRGMAYPDSGILRFESGYKYEDVRNYLSYLGIAYSRSIAGTDEKFRLPNDWYNWLPTAHHTEERIFEIIDKFNSLNPNDGYCGHRSPMLFYLCGHSYEFDRDKNMGWDYLEKICEKIGGKDDVWYATNIEIYDYVEAYNSLRFSVDGLTVQNPTSTEVFFRIGETDYSVKAGETKRLSDPVIV